MLKQKLTKESLYNYLSDSDIFGRYFGNFDFNKSYPSVFRKDINPSTGFYINKEGIVIYNDLATDEKLGAINFVSKLYGLNYGQAIEKIAKDFGIIEGQDNSIRIKAKKYRPPIKRENKYEVTKGKTWTEEELDYWKQFSITKEELEENFIYPCRELKINNFVIENPQNYLRFVYIINGTDGETYFKIYSPHDPVYKWVGSVPKNQLFGLKELPHKSNTLFIVKANKDKIIWKKYFSDVVASQSENKSSIPEEIANQFNEEYDKSDSSI